MASKGKACPSSKASRLAIAIAKEKTATTASMIGDEEEVVTMMARQRKW